MPGATKVGIDRSPADHQRLQEQRVSLLQHLHELLEVMGLGESIELLGSWFPRKSTQSWFVVPSFGCKSSVKLVEQPQIIPKLAVRSAHHGSGRSTAEMAHHIYWLALPIRLCVMAAEKKTLE